MAKIMTKEEIINAILNFDIVEIRDINDKIIISKSCVGYGGDIISVCSKGVLVIYNAANFECMYSLTPFEQIKKITIKNN